MSQRRDLTIEEVKEIAVPIIAKAYGDSSNYQIEVELSPNYYDPDALEFVVNIRHTGAGKTLPPNASTKANMELLRAVMSLGDQRWVYVFNKFPSAGFRDYSKPKRTAA
jgi:hypothetical protein